MNVMTLRDYAKKNNISYEAVRKQVVRYHKELEGHLIRDGRQQFLDEEAVAFLDAKRQKNPVAIIQMDKDDRIEALEKENKKLLLKVAEQAEELRTADKALAEVNALSLSAAKEKERAEALEAQNGNLIVERDKLKKIAEDEHETAEKAKMELSEALEKIDELEKRKWYQLLFRKKGE